MLHTRNGPAASMGEWEPNRWKDGEGLDGQGGARRLGQVKGMAGIRGLGINVPARYRGQVGQTKVAHQRWRKSFYYLVLFPHIKIVHQLVGFVKSTVKQDEGEKNH